jgi:hypothetical protein
MIIIETFCIMNGRMKVPLRKNKINAYQANSFVQNFLKLPK